MSRKAGEDTAEIFNDFNRACKTQDLPRIKAVIQTHPQIAFDCFCQACREDNRDFIKGFFLSDASVGILERVQNDYHGRGGYYDPEGHPMAFPGGDRTKKFFGYAGPLHEYLKHCTRILVTDCGDDERYRKARHYLNKKIEALESDYLRPLNATRHAAEAAASSAATTTGGGAGAMPATPPAPALAAAPVAVPTQAHSAAAVLRDPEPIILAVAATPTDHTPTAATGTSNSRAERYQPATASTNSRTVGARPNRSATVAPAPAQGHPPVLPAPNPAPQGFVRQLCNALTALFRRPR